MTHSINDLLRAAVRDEPVMAETLAEAAQGGDIAPETPQEPQEGQERPAAMNDLLRAAAGGMSVERREQVEAEYAAAHRTPPDAYASDGGRPELHYPGRAYNLRYSSRRLTCNDAMNAMLRDSVEARSSGREPSDVLHIPDRDE